ncbi:MAG: hypothetical protein JWQ11_1165 [Rhizobacter sp.]|nr:hypothetical protein [Rhizobacter sp.]
MRTVGRAVELLVALACLGGTVSFAVRGMWPQAGFTLFALLLVYVIHRVNRGQRAP